MFPVKIAGSGWYLPERRVTNEELEERLQLPAQWIAQATGVHERRYVTDETTLTMAASASQMALANAGLEVDALDALICAQTAPYQAIPCTAALLQRELQAPEGKSACFDVNATCLSFLVAFQMAAHLVAAGIYKHVLICSSEIASCSLNPNERESAVLFGDAAAAVVLTRSQEGEASAFWHAHFETYSSGADLTELLGGGTNHHPNDPATTPEMNMFHMRGPAIFRQAAVLMGPFLDRFFAKLGWERSELDVIVPHQASRHAVEQLSRRLGFHNDQLVMNLALRGNCISASIPLAFAESVANGRIQRDQRVLLVGTGAGLTLGALALTY
ncbi:MAG TPA: beta-ketoacyl-ACP synthase 3 [Ktedonobacteraceae bacterium]